MVRNGEESRKHGTKESKTERAQEERLVPSNATKKVKH